MTSSSDRADRWVPALLLLVVSDVSRTLATFMPMKAVFLLASSDVPDFLPSVIRDLGAVAVALLLVVGAAFFGGVAAGSRALVEQIDRRKATVGETIKDSKTRAETRTFWSFELSRSQAAKGLLFTLLLLGLLAISPLFAGLVLLWLLIVGTGLSLRIRSRPRQAPYSSGVLEFRSKFRQTVTASALWVAVGAAIVTLLMSVPSLGLTGILLGAVLAQRIQVAGGIFFPALARNMDRSDHRVTSHIEQAPVPISSPFDFFSTSVGERLLTSAIKDAGWNGLDWWIIGQPGPESLSLAAGSKGARIDLIVRVFSYDRDDLRNHEVFLRSLLHESVPAKDSNVVLESFNFAGFPALQLNVEGALHPETSHFTKAEVRKYQVEAEVWSASLPELVVPNTKSLQGELCDQVFTQVRRLIRLPGAHQTSLEALIPLETYLREALSENVSAVSFGGSLHHNNYLRLRAGQLLPLDLTAWKMSPLGTDWVEPDSFQKIYHRALALSKCESLPPVTVPLLQRRFHELHRAITARRLDTAAQLCSEIVHLIEGGREVQTSQQGEAGADSDEEGSNTELLLEEGQTNLMPNGRN